MKLGNSVPTMTNHNGLVADTDEEWSMVRDDDDMSQCSDDSDCSYISDASPAGAVDPTMLSNDELNSWLQRLPP